MANDTHIQWLIEGEAAWNVRRESLNFRPDFSFADIPKSFRQAGKLDHNGRVPLNRFNLSDSNFTGANLSNVDLMGTNLQRAKMPGAQLYGVSFFQTDLSCVEFGSAYFGNIDFGFSILKDTDFVNGDLIGAELAASQFWKAKLFPEPIIPAPSYPDINLDKAITRVADLIERCSEISGYNDQLTLYFRGERNDTWELRPSVMRPSADGEFRLRTREGEMLRDLISRWPQDFSGMTTALEQLVVAQHHGLKTRLLDVTRNPCVALFSACDERDRSGMYEENKMDGRLHVFGVPQSMVKPFDSDTVSIIANFAKLERHYQSLLLGKTLDVILNESSDSGIKPLYSEGMRRLRHLVRQEKPQFEIDPRDFFRVFVVKPKQSFERIRAQEGAFSCISFP